MYVTCSAVIGTKVAIYTLHEFVHSYLTRLYMYKHSQFQKLLLQRRKM